MHTIRLRRPWLRTLDDQGTPDRVDVPDNRSGINPGAGPGAGHGAGHDDASNLTYRRVFNRPTGLQSGDKLWLAIESFRARQIGVLLNDKSIFLSDVADPIRIEITSHLKHSNQLVIQLLGSDACLSGAVTLQIETEM